MAAYQMGTGRLLVVHTPNDINGRLPSRYQLVDELDAGPGWLVARDSLLDPRIHRSLGSDLSLGEKE